MTIEIGDKIKNGWGKKYNNIIKNQDKAKCNDILEACLISCNLLFFDNFTII